MKIEQVAIQYFTLRDFISTPEGFAETCKKVSDIGYQAVQISGMGDNPMPEEEIVEVCKANNLTLCATHEPAKMIVDQPEKVVERLQKLNCKYTAYPYPGGVDLSSKEELAALIKKLDHAGKVLADAGQVLTYHNHALEFAKIDGKLIMDKIYDETNPSYLQGEIDTYWVQRGGGDPVDWCHKLKNRLPLVHLKDFRITPDQEIHFGEIGYGNLNFPKIIKAAEDSGCEWFIVEQDRCPGDPFESIAKSFNYIKENLVS